MLLFRCRKAGIIEMKRIIPAAALLMLIPFMLGCNPDTDLPSETVEAPTAQPVVTAEPPAQEDVLIVITPSPSPTPEPTEVPTPTPEPTPTPTPTPAPTPSPTPEPEGLIGWTAGGFVPREEAYEDEDEYVSDNLHITVKKVVDNETYGKKLTYYIADIYLRDITSLRTSAAKSFRNDDRARVKAMADREKALIAISGDMFNAHKNQLVIRNGEVYKNKTYQNWEVCLLYLDGSMEAMTVEEYHSRPLRDDIWQAWEFGPSLLGENGAPLTSFPNSKVKVQNPRSVIGYYEPGHYCFVTVDGRQKHSRGLTMAELSQLMSSLGCKVAYNLDGGESASMYWNGDIFNKPSDGGRAMADIVYIVEPSEGSPAPTSNP